MDAENQSLWGRPYHNDFSLVAVLSGLGLCANTQFRAHSQHRKAIWSASKHSRCRAPNQWGLLLSPFCLCHLLVVQGRPCHVLSPHYHLALSDAGAALVGKQYGSNRFRVMDGYRSFEGSLTFFGLSLTILLVGFAIAKVPGWPEMLLIAITVSVLTTAIEAISIRGLDNLLIPCSVYLMLERSLRIGLAELSSWFEGMLLSLLTILLTHRISRLTTAGSISIFVAGSMAYALGSWQWFIPLLSLYIAYTSTNPKERSMRTDMVVVFPTILGALCFILLYGHYQDPNLYLGYLSTLCSGGAISMRMMAQRLEYPSMPFVLTGALAPLIPLVFVPHPNVQTHVPRNVRRQCHHRFSGLGQNTICRPPLIGHPARGCTGMGLCKCTEFKALLRTNHIAETPAPMGGDALGVRTRPHQGVYTSFAPAFAMGHLMGFANQNTPNTLLTGLRNNRQGFNDELFEAGVVHIRQCKAVAHDRVIRRHRKEMRS